MVLPNHPVEFTKRGKIFDDTQVEKVLENLAPLSDLFVISHGWNNNMAEAEEFYEAFFRSVSQVISGDIIPGLRNRKFGVVKIFWPSKKFTDEQLIPGGGVASADAANDRSLLDLLEQLKHDPDRLGGEEIDPVREVNLKRAQELVPALESDVSARREYVFLLRSILNPSDSSVDDGSEEFFSREPLELFQEMDEPVTAPLPINAGGATSLDQPGGAAGLTDLLSGVKAAARRIANFATYYQMKERAGVVGRNGMNQVLRAVRQQKADLRLHLIGHSFGGRLMTAGADGLSPNTPAVTLLLLQAAFSHNGLAKTFDGKHDGSFRKLVSEKRASGPILITHTKNDRAVGIAYPLASRIANQKAAALGDENDPYGGMGRNGAQRTPEAEAVPGGLQEVGAQYQFASGKVFNLKADRFIKDHGDVTGLQAVYAMLTGLARM